MCHIKLLLIESPQSKSKYMEHNGLFQKQCLLRDEGKDFTHRAQYGNFI